MMKMNLEAKARAGFHSIMLRGGRLVKRKGQVLSYAPHVGHLASVSHGVLAVGLAVGATLLGSGPASAGTCSPLNPAPESTVTCSGPAAADATQTITGQQVTVVTTPDFDISTAAGDAIIINSSNSYSTLFGLNFTDDNASQITATAGSAMVVNSSGNTTVTTNGILTGSDNGLQLAQSGSQGAVTIDSTGTIAGIAGNGVLVTSDGEARDITVNTNIVNGGTDGISVTNGAYGDTLITASGPVAGATGIGIFAYNDTLAKGVTISAIDVSGATDGISVDNKGDGDTSITATGNVTGGETGIFANTAKGATAISVTGNVIGGADYSGIQVTNAFSALDLTVTAAATSTVTGGAFGVNTLNSGRSAATLMTLDGDVTSLAGTGVSATNETATTDLTILGAGDITGDTNGILASNAGEGSTLVDVTGKVTGTDGTGIDVSNALIGTNLTVIAVDVAGGQNGIVANSNGRGTTIVAATGLVGGTATDGYTTADGINVTNTNAGNSIVPAGQTAVPLIGMQVSAHDVNGGVNGIFADHNGAGGLVITADGIVNGRSAAGINANNSTEGTYLSITTATVTGGVNGIYAVNNGKGATSITSTGDVTGDGSFGIAAANLGAETTDLTIEARGTVTAGNIGIAADNRGVGATSITATGAVTGAGQAGIGAFNEARTTDMTVDAVDVAGGQNGIFAENLGTGVTVVSATGLVGGIAADGYTTLDGIHVANSALGNTVPPAGQTAVPLIGMKVSAHDVNGGVDGIFADHNGAGGLVITADGIVNGRSAFGINANNSTDGTYLSITTATVTGGNSGVFAVNNGDGATSITTNGAVTGEGANGIDVLNANVTTDLTIVAEGDVYGLARGISAANNGLGVLSITATGDVVGKNEDGIRAVTGLNTTGVTQGANVIVDAANVTGGSNGIFVRNTGGAGTLINASGTVTGTTGAGIDVANDFATSDLTITANIVTGDTNGISARNDGDGSTSVTAIGLVAGGDIGNGGFNGNGIDVFNDASASALTVNAAAVTGGLNGILVDNDGFGATFVLSSGAVTGTTADGIYAETSGTNLTIAPSGAVTGGDDGIDARNNGNGFTSITSTGAVNGNGGDGIFALNANAATDLTIIAEGDVYGLEYGISAANNGSGVLSITATGDVNAVGEDGIRAVTGLNTTGVTAGANVIVDAANVYGGSNGIFVSNTGGAATSISASGTVKGANGNGIAVPNDFAATDLTVLANIVTGNNNGIDAENDGTGFTLVAASGLVSGGAGGSGIDVFNDASATALTVNANAVTAGLNGIFAENLGTGTTIVTASGLVGGTAVDGYTTADGIHVANSALGNTVAPAGQTVAPLIGMQVSARDVNGGANGIFADHNGAGGLVITADGTVNGRSADGIYADNSTAGTYLSITTTGPVLGGVFGIDAENNGNGDTFIKATGKVTGGLIGVNANNENTSGNLTVDVVDVTGGIVGVNVVSDSIGGVTHVISKGKIEATQVGVYATAVNAIVFGAASDLVIEVVDVTGADFGIAANNNATGATSITATGTVTGAASDGIFAYNDATATDLTVDAVDVAGGQNGIFAENLGTGVTIVSATGVVGGTAVDGFTTANGINVANSAIGNTAIPAGQAAAPLIGMQVSAHDVNGGVNGIFADHNGAGGLVITADGIVNGLSANGIYADNSALGTYLAITTATVTGGVNGVFAVNNGKGATSITSTGDVTGDGSFGIAAFNLGGDTTDLTIAARGTVTGGNIGILADNRGVGATLITATGVVTGGGQAGIDAFNNASATDLTVNAVDVAGGGTGIVALNNGTGTTVVTATGLIGGTAADGYTTADGISVTNSALGNTVAPAGQTVAPLIGMQVSAHDVNGGVNGIFADHNGAGGLVITADGTVNGRSADGIFAENAATAQGLSITANNVTGGDDGIYAFSFGAGVTSVTATGTVSGGDNGIDVTNILSGTGLTVVANTVTGGDNGIDVANNAKGSTSITSTGLVTGTAGNGIDAYNATTTDSLSISANDVSGSADGIFATNNGAGSTSVIATGAVTGSDGYGITASNGTTALNLTVAANDVTGGQTGIYAFNDGTGSTSITATGDVTGTAADGIFAENAATAQGLSITANNVTGGDDGIYAFSFGAGVTSVTATGTVSGGDNGIDVTNILSGTGLTVVANTVTGGDNGIDVANNAKGSTSITSTGLVTGTAGNGIDAYNATTTDSLSISANDVSGSADGIFATNNGTGSTSVIATGAVNGSDGYGITASNGTTALNLTVAANDVTGATAGILVVNKGTGVTSVSATGVVTGTAIDGINIRNSGTDLSVSVNDVTGGDDGIDVFNSGLGATSITSTGIVTGGDNGIEVINGAAGTNLTVITKDVTADDDGINAFNLGSGSTIIRSTGAVTGGKQGIFAFNAVTAENLTINVVNVNGATYGISVANLGSGVTSVTSTGTIEGTDTSGIYAYNASEASGLTVSANNVTGGVDGIYVVHNGTGDTVVTATGDVEGATGAGILATALNADGGELRITAKSASGLLGGIVAQNDGVGASTVSVSGTISGGDSVGIETSTLAGNLTTVNLAGTAIIGATSGKAIANNEGNSILNVSANAVINGSVELDSGNDTANFARNGALASINLLDGGDDAASADGSVDTLNLNGVDDVNLVGANTVNWEVININGGTIGFSDAGILAETINVNNRATLNGANNLVVNANTSVNKGGTLLVGNATGNANTRVVGNLSNSGLVNLSGASAKVGDKLNVSGNYTGADGQITFDTALNGDSSLTDLVNVNGNVGGKSIIAVNNVGGVGGVTTGDGIKLVQVGGTSTADAFALVDDLQVGGVRFDLFLGGISDPNDQDWYLRTSGLSDVATSALSFARLGDDIAMTFLGTLHERVGEQEHLAKRGYESSAVSGLWGRFVGKGFRERLSSDILGDVKSNGSITGLQMGFDLNRSIHGDGSATFTGLYGGYADAKSNDQNVFNAVARRSGSSDSKSWLTGLYATHYGSSNWYVNAVLQLSFLDAAVDTRAGEKLKTDGRTVLGSLELGKALKLGSRLALEPQIQVIYGDTRFDAAADSTGILNETNVEDTVTGRVGLRLKTTKDEKYNADGGLFSGYLKVNLWHNLLGSDVSLTSAGIDLGKFEPKKTWLDAGLGTTLTMAKNTEIFFDADVEFGLDQKTTAGTGKIGLRFNW